MTNWGSLAIDFAIILILILGISRFRTPRGGRFGNLTAAFALALALVVVVQRHHLTDLRVLLPVAVLGTVLGWLVAERVNMIRIPSLVAIQNGAGGLASFLVSFVELVRGAGHLGLTAEISGFLGLVVGAATFSGSVVAAGKLDNKIRQTPVVLPRHSVILFALAAGMVLSAVWAAVGSGGAWLVALLCLSVFALVAGVVFSIRIGGADMPVLISFLNSGSGLAAALCGMVIANRLLIACGATVAVSGLILTQVMCHAMNRNLISVFTGIKLKRVPSSDVADPVAIMGLDDDAADSCVVTETADVVASDVTAPQPTPQPTPSLDPLTQAAQLAREAESVIIVPGYGLALAHAASDAVALGRRLEQMGKDVRYAVHPVAGRMPGHMHVLLAEAEVDYDKLYEMDAINPRFADTDLALIVGACDVVNPQAVQTEDTPISGMPILHADQARHVVVLNLDDKPGYSGVPNSLYTQPHTVMVLGDAKHSLEQLRAALEEPCLLPQPTPQPTPSLDPLTQAAQLAREAESVIIVPGYGLALAHAASDAVALGRRLEQMGKDVRYAVHPVAGRMPGHMHVLLAEAEVDYDKLYEMDAINPRFADTDLALIVGACDVVNPQAVQTEDTPISGMPILHADQARHVVVLNLDDKPGYSGVPNSLYTQPHTVMVLGDAKHSLEQLRAALEEPCLLPQPTPQPTPSLDPLTQAAQLAREAESVIIVPGYGLALAHAASDAVALGRRLEQMGKDVRYAVHPVAGRMPGHMHVLLAEAEVDYDKLYEMDAINPRFADTDLALIVGACDVVNPQAVQTEDTPISGMPILHADQARHVVVLNLDDKPGYSGVPNSLYTQPHTVMVLGDAKHSLEQLRAALEEPCLLPQPTPQPTPSLDPLTQAAQLAREAESVIIVPGYGLALAHAASDAVALGRRLEQMGKDVRYAVHPVAGRMPGHMHVLLAEAEVDYDKLYEMDAINPRFADTDLALIVGACDVVNPQAVQTEDTPISGMPILHADQARHVVVLNLDDKPGYSGVPNSLYTQPHTVMVLGDAKHSLEQLRAALEEPCLLPQPTPQPTPSLDPLTQAAQLAREAESVIIVPGYGLALAHAASDAVALGRRLEQMGKDVRYAVHPVAGRMPGHMHVLLAEAEVDYDKLYEMDAINPRFADTDLALIVGACDVVNPQAVQTEDTPISGMPILHADQARHVVVLNLDDKPGYSGVPNSLYTQPHTVMVLGDAKHSLEQLRAALEDGECAIDLPATG